jgi:hypothetical protein
MIWLRVVRQIMSEWEIPAPRQKTALLDCVRSDCASDVLPIPPDAKSMAEIKTLKKVRSDEFLTVEEAADFLGIKPTAIRNYLHANRLTTF